MRGANASVPLGVAVAIWLVQPANAQPEQSIGQAVRTVNVTAGSEAGWVPSEELERQALAAADAFLSAVERGDDAEAYRMMADALRLQLTPDQSASDNRAFRKASGQFVSRRFNQVTWTKDSPNAPLPGTYVAIDIAAKYKKIDRFCGYLMLHQANASAPFRVSRIERNYIDNTAAAAMDSAVLKSSWAQISANCPNYRPLELEESAGSTTGYASVAEALADLRSRKDVKFEEQNGWSVAIDEANLTLWSFSPPDYPAYPAVVKRQLSSDGAGTHMTMSVQCEASKEVCDDLVRTFADMNGITLP